MSLGERWLEAPPHAYLVFCWGDTPAPHHLFTPTAGTDRRSSGICRICGGDHYHERGTNHSP